MGLGSYSIREQLSIVYTAGKKCLSICQQPLNALISLVLEKASWSHCPLWWSIDEPNLVCVLCWQPPLQRVQEYTDYEEYPGLCPEMRCSTALQLPPDSLILSTPTSVMFSDPWGGDIYVLLRVHLSTLGSSQHLEQLWVCQDTTTHCTQKASLTKDESSSDLWELRKLPRRWFDRCICPVIRAEAVVSPLGSMNFLPMRFCPLALFQMWRP